MLSAITVSLVPEARQGPFVFHEGLEDACRHAAALGFDAIEIFPPSAAVLEPTRLRAVLAEYGLRLAAVGTGAGWLCHQWSLTSEQPEVRQRAEDFIRGIIDAAGCLGAPAIIGSMQGRAASAEGRPVALNWLGEAVTRLAEHAWHRHGQQLLVEPLNRYETNLLNTLPETAAWLSGLATEHARILADLFHMNIEEADMAAALRAAGPWIGHVHFADSNRRAVGLGHSPLAPAVACLRELGYSGYLSAEIFPRPDAETAARQTIDSFRQLVRGH
jgi:sugar phosphate isomerase/epimerase